MNDTVPDITDEYVFERARIFGQNITFIQEVLGSIALYMADNQSTPEQYPNIKDLGWVNEEDFLIIGKDPRINEAETFLKQSRHTSNEERARELSRCTEWHVLLETFLPHVQKVAA